MFTKQFFGGICIGMALYAMGFAVLHGSLQHLAEMALPSLFLVITGLLLARKGRDKRPD